MQFSCSVELVIFSIVLCVSFSGEVFAEYDVSVNSSCPPWFDHGNGSCYCKKPKHNRFSCKENPDVAVQCGNCITWDDAINSTVLTDCPYFSRNLSEICPRLMYTIPASVSSSNITSYVCSRFNRMGTHCGKCIPGYGPAPFLNGANIPCAKCHHHNYMWAIILFFQLFMVTVLYFTFVLCECRGTASPLSVMAYFYQIVTNSITSNTIVYVQIMCILDKFALLYLNVQAFWNLDFFQFSLPAVCVSSTLTNAQALLFDYLVALCPVLLTLLSYLLIEMHDRGVWLVVKAWKPFNKVISRYKGDWNPKSSILSTFATFLLLSYSKLLFTSANLLYGVPVYDNDREIVIGSILFYDSTIEYFSLKHAPYVFVSLTVILVFVIIPPVLLILFTTKCFKLLLERCGFRHWHFLSTIMDVFQGWYKDGTDGTYDYRSLSALYMVLRVGFASEFILVLMFQYKSMYNYFEWTLPALVHIALGCFYLTVRPYKKTWMNVVDGLILVLMGILSALLITDQYNFSLAYILTSVPLLVASVYIFRRCVVKIKSFDCFKSLFKGFANYFKKKQENVDKIVSVDHDDLPVRLISQSDEITPLQPSVSFHKKSSYQSVN